MPASSNSLAWDPIITDCLDVSCGRSADILDISTEDETNTTVAAEQFFEELEQITQGRHSKTFSDLSFGQRLVFTWEYRSFNTPARVPVLMFAFDTDLVGASGALNLVRTKSGYMIWSLHTAIEGLQGHPEVPARDGHMTGDKSWYAQRLEDDNLEGVEPEVIVIGGGQCGLQIAARLKALGVTSLVVERNQRISDNWRNRYEYLSLHLPHWGDHFPYFPIPEHWPTYTPAAKMGDWHEWYANAMELTT
ncbi:hypothetical protein BO78DRAFT_415327 [Aspergillus sclerotiicarbonarius CBS 121057]|uniref:FAD/NAD(P)-binding domain-containing protein n=1 Tax=Aspergillus sclerotiicarbonarius (strain CBS 121057 / IBT 28362) TaxID=1448318 RepID=A0A319ES42_ASPSB|nr:hypothetical protein BO78DRAFT_415327 [Aspergillus sclerotiicarbonarius CBS 121057]